MLASRSLRTALVCLVLLPDGAFAQSGNIGLEGVDSAFGRRRAVPTDPSGPEADGEDLGVLCFAEDELEGNDDCGDEIPLSDGFYPDLTVSKTDWDYFSLTVAPGGTVEVSITHLQPVGDIDAFLYAPGDCAAFETGELGCEKSLQCATTVSDLEVLKYTNSTAECATYVLRIYIAPWSKTGFCNEYDLVVSGTIGAQMGVTYCAQNNNSTGKVARIEAFGSMVAMDGELTLVARNMPENQAGFFVVSTDTGLVDLPGAGFSDGLLCLGPETGRFNGQAGKPGTVLSTGVAGTFCLPGIDLSMLPSSSGPSYPALAGTSSYFTTWFRDPGGEVGNSFSDAVVVDWE